MTESSTITGTSLISYCHLYPLMLKQIRVIGAEIGEGLEACKGGIVGLDDKVAVIINEMYTIAAELSISTDKATQVYGKQLRKLIDQMEVQLTQMESAD
jgi:hypothetical protein